MFIRCKWEGQPCDPSWIIPRHTDKGYCYTFNHNKTDVLMTRKTGTRDEVECPVAIWLWTGYLIKLQLMLLIVSSNYIFYIIIMIFPARFIPTIDGICIPGASEGLYLVFNIERYENTGLSTNHGVKVFGRAQPVYVPKYSSFNHDINRELGLSLGDSICDQI